MVGRPEKIDDVYLIDGSSLSVFLSRRMPSIVTESGRVEISSSSYNWILKGGITTHKFISFLNNPTPVQFGKSRIKQTYQDIPIDDKVVTRVYLGEEIDNFYSIPNDKVEEYISKITEKTVKLLNKK
ncbi:MAG: hypothetical protein ACOZCL_06630 [Bacillota bacterium]